MKKKENNKINKTLTRDGLGRKNDKLLFLQDFLQKRPWKRLCMFMM